MRKVYGLLLVMLVCAASLATYHLAFERLERSATKISSERLALYREGLRSALERVAHLPGVVDLHPQTRAVLKSGSAGPDFNGYLKAVNDQAGSAALYLLARNGTTIAASNFDTSESFVGSNYRFRKYFTDALEAEEGRFFAVGVTTGRAGYFLSRAILEGDEVLGVAVVKIEFAELLQSWEEAGEDVLISNGDGVVVLASNPNRLYKSLYDIPANRQREMAQHQQFARHQLTRMRFETDTGLFAGRAKIDEQDFSVSSKEISSIGWSLHFLTPLDGVRASAFALAAFAFLLCGLAVIAVLYARARIERSRLEIIAHEAERVREVNVRLESEIAERKRTEARLRDTQAELIQSSRLAALGKMSAAIVHEVNQPVSAIRTFTSSGQLLLKKRRSREASDVFGQIAKMTERLGRITSDLLVFSRKPVTSPQLVDINECIRTISQERGSLIRQQGIGLGVDLWSRPLKVSGSPHRFEQLLGNLLQNAVQACEGMERPVVLITSLADTHNAVVMISDNGAGINPEQADQLFDPFFTTKEVGKGVGLGLALAYAIVDEAGGRIRAENRQEGGARFVVELPLAETKSANSTGRGVSVDG